MGEPPMFSVGRNVQDYIFAKPISSAKFAKISSLENFRLYGTIQHVTMINSYTVYKCYEMPLVQLP